MSKKKSLIGTKFGEHYNETIIYRKTIERTFRKKFTKEKMDLYLKTYHLLKRS